MEDLNYKNYLRLSHPAAKFGQNVEIWIVWIVMRRWKLFVSDVLTTCGPSPISKNFMRLTRARHNIKKNTKDKNIHKQYTFTHIDNTHVPILHTELPQKQTATTDKDILRYYRHTYWYYTHPDTTITHRARPYSRKHNAMQKRRVYTPTLLALVGKKTTGEPERQEIGGV